MSTDNLYLQQILLQLRANGGGGGGGGTAPGDITAGVDGSVLLDAISDQALASSLLLQSIQAILTSSETTQLSILDLQDLILTALRALDRNLAITPAWDDCPQKSVLPTSPSSEYVKDSDYQFRLNAPAGVERQVLYIASEFTTGATGSSGVSVYHSLTNDYAIAMTRLQAANQIGKGYTFSQVQNNQSLVNDVQFHPFAYSPVVLMGNQRLIVARQTPAGGSNSVDDRLVFRSAVVRDRLLGSSGALLTMSVYAQSSLWNNDVGLYQGTVARMGDGNFDTIGATNAETYAWIRFDLGQLKTITRFGLVSGGNPNVGSLASLFLQDIWLESSADGATWTKQVRLSGVNNNALLYFDLSRPTARYLQIAYRGATAQQVSCGDCRIEGY